MSLSDDAVREITGIRSEFPNSLSAVVPSLRVAERDFGWLSEEAMRSVADTLDLPPAVVRGTASFYSLYRHREMGRHLIQLCTNISCLVLGADRLEEFLRARYGLEEGGTTADGKFSLIIMECIGACDGAPAMQVDRDLHCDLTEARIEEILERYD
jgi:NADH-quinone oxidoreductase subunit E